MESPDPWELAKDMGAPTEEECRREMFEDANHMDPLEGVSCLTCGEETLNPIYEVIDLTRGGKTVGYLCDTCAKKVTQDTHAKRTEEEQ